MGGHGTTRYDHVKSFTWAELDFDCDVLHVGPASGCTGWDAAQR